MNITRNLLIATTASITALVLSACGGGQEGHPSTLKESQASATTSAAVCEGHDYQYPDVEPNSCGEALQLVDSVVADGAADKEGVVRSKKAYCKPEGEEWLCGKLDRNKMSDEAIRVVPKSSSDHPLQRVLNKSSS